MALLAGTMIGNVVESYGAAQRIVVGGRPRHFAVGLLAAIGVALAAATCSAPWSAPKRALSSWERLRPSLEVRCLQ